jgi:dihydrofolate synthase/folylpolyglutamate synthase
LSAVDRLFALERFGIKLGLDNIRTLVEALGHPEQAYRSIHIAGTNGKGSVAAMVERGLRAAGLRTGRYTSPHLDRIEERVAIDGAAVDEATFAGVAADVLEVAGRCQRTGALGVPPTFFEVCTAIAFEIFRRATVDVAVVEVGLGGRFDATTVLEPEVTAITSIAFDHERHLGHTLGAIAFEKAGIAKPGVPLVVGTVPDEAAAVIEKVAAGVDAPLVGAHAGVRVDERVECGRVTLTLDTPMRGYPPVRLALAGRHQAGNAVVAVRVLETWSERVAPLPPDAIVTALADCAWPARLEWIRLQLGPRPSGPQTLEPFGDVLIDAAHNPAGAQALAAFLRDAGVSPLPIVLAVMQDKDLHGIVAALAPVASAFWATTVPHARARSAEALAGEMVRHAPAVEVHAESSPDEALRRALTLGPRVVVAGSIFLVGPLRARLMAEGAAKVG